MHTIHGIVKMHMLQVPDEARYNALALRIELQLSLSMLARPRLYESLDPLRTSSLTTSLLRSPQHLSEVRTRYTTAFMV